MFDYYVEDEKLNFILKGIFIFFGIIFLACFFFFVGIVNVNALESPDFQSANNDDFPSNYAFGLNDDDSPFIPLLSQEQKELIITYIDNTFTLSSNYSDYIILFHPNSFLSNDLSLVNDQSIANLEQMTISVYSYNNLKLKSYRYYGSGSDFRGLYIDNYDNLDTRQNFEISRYHFNYNTNSITEVETVLSYGRLPLIYTNRPQLNSIGQQFFTFTLIYNTNSTLKTIPIVSTGSSSYKDTDFQILDLEKQNTFPFVYGINNINEFPLSILSDFTPFFEEEETKFYFTDEIYSVAFYRKDLYTNIEQNLNSNIIVNFKLNGSYTIHPLKFNILQEDLFLEKNIYSVTQYYGIGDYKTYSNYDTSMYWGDYTSINYTEPIFYTADILFDNSRVPIFTKNMPKNVDIENIDSYYIAYNSDNLGYITFDKQGNLINTDMLDRTVYYIGVDGLPVNLDLDDFDILPNYMDVTNKEKIRGMTSFFNNISDFQPTVAFIFSTFSLAYNSVPPMVSSFLVLIFLLGAFIFIIKMIF